MNINEIEQQNDNDDCPNIEMNYFWETTAQQIPTEIVDEIYVPDAESCENGCDNCGS